MVICSFTIPSIYYYHNTCEYFYLPFFASLLLLLTDVIACFLIIRLDLKAESHDAEYKCETSSIADELEAIKFKELSKLGAFFWIINFGSFVA
jgi:hypothetical protein